MGGRVRLAALGLCALALAGCSNSGLELTRAEPGLDVALAALRGGSPQVALQVTSAMLQRNPNNEQALVVQGDALTALGKLPEATDSYTKVLARDPSSVGGHIGLGRIRLASDPARAEALFLEALQIEPRNTTALNDLGIARDLQGHHAAAQQAYEKALGIDPDLHAAQVNLALSLAMTGDSHQAEALLRPLASTPGASRKLRHDLAAVLAMAGDRAAAERILSRDLSPAEVEQALQAYAAARTGTAPTPLLTGAGSAGPVAATPLPAGHAVTVQFAASPTQQDAQADWQRLQKALPDLMVGRTPLFIQADHDGQNVWRLRTGGFTDTAAAHAFCTHVRARGFECMVSGG